MFRVIALVATVAAAGTLAGTASAHPPDLYDSTSYSTGSYGTSYTQPYYGTTSYGTSPYVAPTYSGSTYGTSAYVAPSYSGTTYAPPSYNATPIYTAPPARSYGYGQKRYGSYRGYRGNTYVPTRNAYDYRPLPRDRHRGYGPVSAVPTTEGLNVGYAGGPTFGTDMNPVINGVSLNGAPN